MTLQIGILVFPRVQQLDLTGPFEVFASLPAANVHLIWKDRSAITSATGLVLAPTMTFGECPALDVLCIPGGGGVNALLEDAAVLDFVRTQAENLERWTVMLAEKDLTPAGFKKLVNKMEVLSQLENIRLDTAAKASAQRLAEGISDLVVNQLFKLI